MPKVKKIVAGRGGWSEWQRPPVKRNYRMHCCDCNLVHEMQFRAFAETRQKGKTYQVVELPWPIRAMFRARRLRKGSHSR